MSEKRGSAGSPFFHQGGEPSTLRSIEVADEIAPDTEEQPVPVYVEPQPLVAASNHKTIEIQTVKLADDIDPRKLPTELRLVRPPSVPPPDSSWPLSEAGLVSTQPPLAARRRSRARVAVALLFALLLLGAGLAASHHVGAPASTEPSTSALAAVVAAPAPTSAPDTPAPVASDVAPSNVEPAASAPVANAEPAPSPEPEASANVEAPPSRKRRLAPRAPAKTNAAAAAQTSRDPSSSSKPNKRAIY